MSIDISSLGAQELRQLQRDVQKRIAGAERREAQDKLARVDKLAKELGLSRQQVAEHFGGRGKRVKSALPPKYRNPDESSQTWSGRGRRPRWFEQQLAAGKSAEDLKI